MKRAMWSMLLGGSCALLGACGDEPGAEKDAKATQYAIQVHVPLATDPCGVVTATASVMGPVRNIAPVPIEVVNDAIQGAIMDVPVGRQHQVFVKAYTDSGLEAYSGVSTVDVNEAGAGFGGASIFMFSRGENCPAGGTEGIRIIGSLESVVVDSSGSPLAPAPQFIP
ncbi:hypothetical protein HUA76_42020 [Myxococcus sp. CA056]|uniref:hypothetical protein n=1 Tax=Myxococcus sp. CA056 TaxID=2741740 RepID=UPI00157B484F|nr:hypothetical protein [Myxococcus sp. CA056]NTX17367.1 hypothetical protein [Myxococcus sp. CA056]